jgi:hypothetical protein
MFTPSKVLDKRRDFMKYITTLLFGLLFSSSSMSAVSKPEPIYQAGSQYTAILNTQSSQWHMVPRIRQDFTQSEKDCRTNAVIPTGLWLVTRDGNGNPELLAPSQTILPVGHSGRIPIISCSDLQSNGLAIPAKMIDWLSKNTGAIYVE